MMIRILSNDPLGMLSNNTLGMLSNDDQDII